MHKPITILDELSTVLFQLQLAGSSGKEFHFKHKVLHHARTRRSIAHTRVLKREPLVSKR